MVHNAPQYRRRQYSSPFARKPSDSFPELPPQSFSNRILKSSRSCCASHGEERAAGQMCPAGRWGAGCGGIIALKPGPRLRKIRIRSNRALILTSARNFPILPRLERVGVKKPATGALLLALIPYIGICFSVSLWDRVYPLLFGLPFNLFWLICWIPLTSLCLWGAYQIQNRSGKQRAGE